MKVIKRNGNEVSYDRNKIITAVQKANAEVSLEEKIIYDRIEEIIKEIESFNQSVYLVIDRIKILYIVYEVEK